MESKTIKKGIIEVMLPDEEDKVPPKISNHASIRDHEEDIFHG